MSEQPDVRPNQLQGAGGEQGSAAPSDPAKNGSMKTPRAWWQARSPRATDSRPQAATARLPPSCACQNETSEQRRKADRVEDVIDVVAVARPLPVSARAPAFRRGCLQTSSAQSRNDQPQRAAARQKHAPAPSRRRAD